MRAVIFTVVIMGIGACSPPPRTYPDASSDTPMGGRVSGTLDNMWDGFALDLVLSSGTTVEHLSVAHDGPFAFAADLQPDARFEITIAAPPEGHVCTIDGASGTADAAAVHVDCRVVTDISLAIPSDFVFSPTTEEYDVPTSILDEATTVTVTAPRATRVTVESVPTTSAAPSQVFALPMGDRVLSIAATVGPVTKTVFLHFRRGARPLKQYAYIKASQPETGARFGASVAAAQDTIAVGAPGEAQGTGAVYTYRRHGFEWAFESRITAGNAQPGDAFGTSISLDHDLLAIGAPGEAGQTGFPVDNRAPGAGAVYVFARSQQGWSQAAYVKAKPAAIDTGDHFGTSVALDADLLVVGAPGEDSAATRVDGDASNNASSNSGAAYLFRHLGDWSQIAYLKASNTEPTNPTGADGDAFGTTVSIAGTMVLVGAPFEDSGSASNEQDNSAADSGAVYRYIPEPHGIRVPLDHYIKGTLYADMHYGRTLSQCGRTSVEMIAARAAFLVLVDATFFTYVLESGSSTPLTDDFGAGLSCLGKLLMVGAANYPGGGILYVEPLIAAMPGTALSPLATVKASNRQAADLFGSSVSTSLGTIVVGAPGEASASSLVNGDESDNSMPSAGAVYVLH